MENLILVARHMVANRATKDGKIGREKALFNSILNDSNLVP